MDHNLLIAWAKFMDYSRWQDSREVVWTWKRMTEKTVVIYQRPFDYKEIKWTGI